MKVHVVFEEGDAVFFDEVRFTQKICNPACAGDGIDTLLRSFAFSQGRVLATALMVAIESDPDHLWAFLREFEVETLLEMQEQLIRVISGKQRAAEQ